MKRPSTKGKVKKRSVADDILPEYDFSKAARNKYASRYAAGSSVVVLEPDVAAAFPTSGGANDARMTHYEPWRLSSTPENDAADHQARCGGADAELGRDQHRTSFDKN